MTKRGWTLSAAVGLFSFGAMLAPAYAEDELNTGKQLDEANQKVDDAAKETTTKTKTTTETATKKAKKTSDKAKDTGTDAVKDTGKKIDDTMK